MKKLIVLILFLCLVGFVSCKKKDNPMEPPEPPDLIEETTRLFDHLEGEWSWFVSFCNCFACSCGSFENEVKSIIRILSQNRDSSINYEIIVEDTLFHKGSFQAIIEELFESDHLVDIEIPQLSFAKKNVDRWRMCINAISILEFVDYYVDTNIRYNYFYKRM